MATDTITTSQTPRRIILGLMTLGPDTTHGARITSLSEFRSALTLFQNKGYTELDTARLYDGGRQESFTRQAGYQERGLRLATKVYPLTPGQHAPEILKVKLHESLAELGTERVDIFYLHGPDRATPWAETLGALDELYRAGKFKRLGLSNYSAFEIAEMVTLCAERGWVRPTVYQAVYNALTRGIDDELIPACRRYGIDVVIFNPLAGGIFSGKYKAADKPAEGRFSDRNSIHGKMYRDRYFKDSVFEALGLLEPLAAKHGLTLVEIALRWCVHHSKLRIVDGNDGVITGVSSLGQLESNLEDLEKAPLPEEIVEGLDRAWMLVKADAARYWHGEFVYGYDTQEVLFEKK